MHKPGALYSLCRWRRHHLIESRCMTNKPLTPALPVSVVIRAEEDVVIPIYVAEHAFEGDWRPEVGQYVTGSLWLQAYALGLEKSPT